PHKRFAPNDRFSRTLDRADYPTENEAAIGIRSILPPISLRNLAGEFAEESLPTPETTRSVRLIDFSQLPWYQPARPEGRSGSLAASRPDPVDEEEACKPT